MNLRDNKRHFSRNITRLAVIGVVVGCVSIAGVAISRHYASINASAASSETQSEEIRTVIVRFKDVDFEQTPDTQHIQKLTSDLDEETQELPGHIELIQTYDNFPLAVFEVDEAGLETLESNDLVESVIENQLYEREALIETTSPIETIDGSYSAGFSNGYSGSGKKIIVIDDGVDKNHAALSNKVVSEACFGLNQTFTSAVISSLCPGAVTSSYASGSALPCIDDCNHGTMVAAAAAMTPMEMALEIENTVSVATRGVASGAKIIAIKATIRLTDNTPTNELCEGVTSCIRTYDSVSLGALDYAVTLAQSDPDIVAVNYSVGGGISAGTVSECKGNASYDLYNEVFGVLRSLGVAPVVAAGNGGTTAAEYNKITFPACTENAIAVAATKNDGIGMAYYSNNSVLTDILAPGGDMSRINADGHVSPTNMGDALWLPLAFSSNKVAYAQGSSFAAPMVAGAFAVLREKNSEMTVNELVQTLQNTGVSVNDNRTGHTVGAKKLIQVNAALGAITASNNTPTNPTDPSNPGGSTDDVPNTGDDILVPMTGDKTIMDEGMFAAVVEGDKLSSPLVLPAALVVASSVIVLFARVIFPRKVSFRNKKR